MKLFEIVIVLFTFVLLNCNIQKTENSKIIVDDFYASKLVDMQNINSQDVVISTALMDTSNVEIKVNELAKDHFLVIKLWATWCTPCIESMQEFEKLKDQYKNSNGIKFYTISIDQKYEDWKKMIKKNDWKIDHYWAGANEKNQIFHLTYELMDSIVLMTLPNYVILDGKGKVKENIITNESTRQNLEKCLKELAME